MAEYRLSKGWRIFLLITIPLMMAAGAFLLFEPVIPGLNNAFEWNSYLLTGSIGLGMVIFCAILIPELAIYRITIDENSIAVRSMFGNRKLCFDEIKGFKIEDPNLRIIPHGNDKKRISIGGYTYIGAYEKLLEHLSANFPNLSKTEIEKEKEEILTDETYGFSQEEREQKLNRTKIIATTVNRIAIIISLWAWFFPEPYAYAIIVSIIVPIITIIIVRYSKGLIRFGEKKDSAYPTVNAAFLPCIALLIRALSDYNIDDHTNIWLPSALIAISMTTILIVGNREVDLSKGKAYAYILTSLIILFAYGFGIIAFINCYYDESEPLLYEAKIIDKRISSGKSTTYYLGLASWGAKPSGEEVWVSGSLYKHLNIGDTVDIYYQKGNLNIPWFQVMKH